MICLSLVFISFGSTPRVEWLGYMVTLYLTYWGTACFPQRLHHFTFPPVVHQASNFFISLPTLVIFSFFFFFVTILQGVNGYLIAILMCISIITTEVGCLFMPLLAICVSSLEKCLFISFAHLACLSSCFPVALYISGSAPCAFSHYVWPGSGGGVAAPVRRMSASSVHCCVPFVSGSAPRTQ